MIDVSYNYLSLKNYRIYEEFAMLLDFPKYSWLNFQPPEQISFSVGMQKISLNFKFQYLDHKTNWFINLKKMI